MSRLIAIVAVAGIVAACVPAASARPLATVSPEPPTQAPAATPPDITVTAASYGGLTLLTAAGARCNVAIQAPRGRFGESPPTAIDGTADASGVLALTYPTPRIPTGSGSYGISCVVGGRPTIGSAPFAVAMRPIDPSVFFVRVRSADPGDGFTEDPALVARRDAILALTRRTLEPEWKVATRGLGAVRIVDDSADILIRVVAQAGTSVNRSYPADGSKDIVVYAADPRGPISPENGVAIALHELGHIWCCSGPGTTDGHWTAKELDPGLAGIDRYGLMNHPVECLILRTGFESCPNRFSERELRAMGFTRIPPAPPDSCVTQQGVLRSQLNDLDPQVDAARRELDGMVATIDGFDAQIRALERQYPGGMPADVYARYTGLIAQRSSLAGAHDARVPTFNGLVDRRNAVAQQLNALPC